MNRLLSNDEFCNLEQQAKNLTQFGKRSANTNAFNQFKSECNYLKSEVSGNVRNLLSELVDTVKETCGRDREHWLPFVYQTLSKIRRYGVEKDLS